MLVLTISSAFHVLVFPTTIDYSLLTWQMCQNMKGSVNGKCGKMCSITTKFGGGNKKTLDAYGISVWRLQFENWRCKLSKDWDYGLGSSSNHFKNCVKNLSVNNCISLHFVGKNGERTHWKQGLPQCEVMASTIPKKHPHVPTFIA